MDIYACDLDSHTPADLRRVIEKPELKNSFWRSRNRYRRFTSAFSESSLRTPSLVKTTDFIILVFSYLKINSLVIPYLQNIFNFEKKKKNSRLIQINLASIDPSGAPYSLKPMS